MKDTKSIAAERVAILMRMAEEVFAENKSMANRYVEHARKIAMRYTLKFPREWKKRICKHCYSFLKPGINCRVRTQKGRVVITCLECSRAMRIPIRKIEEVKVREK